MKIKEIKSEEELYKFLKEKCYDDEFLKYFLEELNKSLIDYYEYENNIDFGAFIKLRSVLCAYLSFKYNVILFSIDLTEYFCRLNELDIDEFIKD